MVFFKMSIKISSTDKKFFQIRFQRLKIHRDTKFQRDRRGCPFSRHLSFILTFLKIKVIYSFILTFFILNFFIGGNPFKGIHLTPFRIFLPKFLIIRRGSFLKVYPVMCTMLYIRYNCVYPWIQYDYKNNTYIRVYNMLIHRKHVCK